MFKRQTTSLKHSRRCLVNHTRNDSPMSETSDEEVDYGSPEIDAIPHTDSDHAWSTHMEMIVKTKWQG